MVHLLRLVYGALALLLSSCPSHALVPATSQWTVGYGSPPCVAADPVSAAQACFERAWPGRTITNCRITSGGTSQNFAGGYCHQGQYDDAWGATKGAASCPANSIPAGGSNCACSTGYFEVGGLCLNGDKNACFSYSVQGLLPGGALTQEYRYQGNVADGTQMCSDAPGLSAGKGCKVTFSRDSFLDYGGGESVTEGTLSMSPDSNVVDQSCNLGPGENPKPKPPEEKCPDGYTGTVNGVEVCISKVPDSGNDGGGDNNDETETDNGTTTTRTTRDRQTSCSGGTCTTTTTTTTRVTNNSTGTSTVSTSTSTSTQPQAGFCKENPGSKLCGGGDGKDSLFSGSCSGGFQCEGDAIQCAMAQEQHRRACQLWDTEVPEYKLYEQEKVKTGKVTENLEGNRDVDISAVLNANDQFLGAGACPADQVIDLGDGLSFSIPFASLCPFLAMLGHVIVVCASISAVYLVIKRG